MFGGRCCSECYNFKCNFMSSDFHINYFYLDFFIYGLNYTFIQVRQYLLDDVSEFLSTKFVELKGEMEMSEDKGCTFVLKAFIDYLFERERENFRARRKDNENSVTLTTIHQVPIPLD